MSKLIFMPDGNFFDVIDIEDASDRISEPLGTKAKFWYRDAEGIETLFKLSRPGTGEHWSEKISSELCSLLGLPHAHYEIATYDNQIGVVSSTFLPNTGRLIHGNEIIPSVNRGEKGKVHYGNTEHTIRKVMLMFSINSTFISPPPNFTDTSWKMSAADIFVGYLMLDAWIGNTDRHSENWALYRHEGKVFLSPSYDHASSLGRIESDERKFMMINTRDRRQTVEAYASKAKSAFYRDKNDEKTLGTLDAFTEAAYYRKTAAVEWAERLRNIKDEHVDRIIEMIPKDVKTRTGAVCSVMTDISKDFCKIMLKFNQDRIIENVRRMK